MNDRRRINSKLALLLICMLMVSSCGGRQDADNSEDGDQTSSSYSESSSEHLQGQVSQAEDDEADQEEKLSERESMEVTSYDLTNGQLTTEVWTSQELDPLWFEADVLSGGLQTEPSSIKDTLLSLLDFASLYGVKDTIFGADDRSYLSYKKRTTYPYCAMVSIEARYPNGEWCNGSGFMIGQNTVATCAHMLYSYARGGPADLIYVYAGRDGDSKPYGEVMAMSYSFPSEYSEYSMESYTFQAMSYDYGLIQLEENLGTKVGWLSLMPDKVPGEISITGFYDFRENTVTGSVDSYDDNILYYTLDTLPGSSGSPIYDSSGNVYGINIAQNEYSNKGVRITGRSYSFLTQYSKTAKKEDVAEETEAETREESKIETKAETEAESREESKVETRAETEAAAPEESIEETKAESGDEARQDTQPETIGEQKADRKEIDSEGITITDGMYFPDSDLRYLTDAEIEGLSVGQLRYAINEIYARHGYIFSKKKYKNYYSQYDWYLPTYKKSSKVEKFFNSYEKKNVKKLQSRYNALEASKDTDGMIFPDSNARYLNDAEVNALSATDLRYAINEIYARRGYKFTKALYRDYYSKYSWYQPLFDTTDEVEKLFNKYEAANIEKLAG